MNKNKLKFKFNSPRNCRLKSDMRWVSSIGYISCIIAPGNKEFHNKWISCEEFHIIRNTIKNLRGRATTQPCRCFRKYKRILRKNPILIGNSKLIAKYTLEGYARNYFTIESIQ